MPRASLLRSDVVQRVLGYLNYSSGKPDPQFLRGMNDVFAALGSRKGAKADEPLWRAVHRQLREQLAALAGGRSGFEQTGQAEAVLQLVFEALLPAYRQHHRDLLFHHSEASLFRPLFVGRACEAVLSEGPPWSETDRIVRGAIGRLNDYLGHRPLAVLEGSKRMAPYDHERVRPIPLWIRDVGAEAGRFQPLIEATIDLLRRSPPELLRQAWFDPELLEELAVDPRAYDFEHPANRRPNYQFGLWDPDHIDKQGYYRRFVLQEVTLEAIQERIEERTDLPRKQMLLEGAAVLAGTMLMGSGVSGDRPGAHDSETTLADLLPHIAGYRDAFYEDLMGRIEGRHAKRLAAEAARLQQPFGGARQHLNQQLVRRRASQLQHVHLARMFARMGYSDAAAAQSRIVPVASARMICEMECRLTLAHQQLDDGALDDAVGLLAEVKDLLHRAIECGALVDPWNILGFDAHFSLFPSVGDSCYDQRVDDLLDLMESIFALDARLQTEAAAAGNHALQTRLADELAVLADWWDRFATTEVSAVEGISGRSAWESAKHVAASLGAWHRAGTAAGDIAFWREHVERFTSPKAYALVVEALLDQGDLVAAMALLMQWLSQADTIPLAEGSYSFHQLALQWMDNLWADSPDVPTSVPRNQRWAMTRKFMDYLEAGGEAYWKIPRLELASATPAAPPELEDAPDEAPAGGLYDAAYENVTYRDSTDDGFEGAIFDEGDDTTDFELAGEAQRISRHLAFTRMLARLWYKATSASAAEPDPERADVLAAWRRRALVNQSELRDLLSSVHNYPIPRPAISGQSMIEYDRREGVKEMLLERIIVVAVETSDAARRMLVLGSDPLDGERDSLAGGENPPWMTPAVRTLRAMRRGDVEAIQAEWPALTAALAEVPILYTPVGRGGAPHRVVAARCLHDVLTDLLAGLPKLGLLGQTGELLELIRRMERRRPAGPANITEFDRLFGVAFRGVIRALIGPAEEPADPDALVELIETIAEPFVQLWLGHSQRLRISPLEGLTDEDAWLDVKEFIQEYGHDLFTQPFMTFGNLRGIMTQGARAFLEWLAEQPDADEEYRLVADLERGLDADVAARLLEIVIESILEHYNEYLDYNSSTTQSDRGEMLYSLLDFLRLLAHYERLNWHLQPLVWAHDELLGRDQTEAAQRWRDRFAEQTRHYATEYLQRYEELVQEYAMRLRSVADRLGERFILPLEVDRLRKLIAPAIEEAYRDGPRPAFAELSAALERFTEEPSGVGFVVPPWLDALEEEVERVRNGAESEDGYRHPEEGVPEIRISPAEARRRVQAWAKRSRKKKS